MLARDPAGSLAAGTAAFYTDLLQCTDKECPSVRVRSRHAARKGWDQIIESAGR
jgi:hypothetical protein